MAGSRPLRRIQFGRQSAFDSGAVATYKYRGKGTILDNAVVQRINADVGIVGGTTDLTNIPMTGGGLALGPDVASFEQMLHLSEMSIKTVTPVQDGTGADPYIFTYPFPTTAIQTFKYYTVEGGDNQQEEEMINCFCKDWTLSGSARNPYQLSANLQGGTVTPSTFTADPGLITHNNMNFGMTKVYFDVVSGTIGTTQVSNTVRGLNFKYVGMQAKDTADGRLDFSFAQEADQEGQIILDIEFEHDVVAVAQKVLWRAKTPRLLQIKVEGSTAFANAGDTYSVPTMLLNLAGYWENFGKIGESNGNDIVSGKFICAYNSTAALRGTLILAVALSAVP